MIAANLRCMKLGFGILSGVLVQCAAAFLLPASLSAKAPDSGVRTLSATSWVEQWDPAAQRWVKVTDSAPGGILDTASVAAATTAVTTTRMAQRAAGGQTIITTQTIEFALPEPAGAAAALGARAPVAQYGPFHVIDASRAVMMGGTDIASPRHFDAMLREWPMLRTLELIDAPGTSHDLANLALGRKIRAAGLATHVPRGGSVRSGAVELFLAGTHQSIAPGATFAVHSWMDSRGLEPRHFAADAPENRLYLDYYEEMGMAPDRAREFYAMTNSVPHSGALWLDAATMRNWINDSPAVQTQPALVTPTLAIMLAPRDLKPVFAATRQAMAQAVALAHMASAPRLGYSDLGHVVLARLDSQQVFP